MELRQNKHPSQATKKNKKKKLMNTGVRLYERNGPTKKDKHTVEDNIFIKYKVFSYAFKLVLLLTSACRNKMFFLQSLNISVLKLLP